MRGTYRSQYRGLILAVLALLLTFMTSNIAWSQQVNGRVEGYLRNPDDQAVSGATLTMSGPDLQGLRTSSSLADGYFAIEVLPVGTYEVRISATGYIESVLAGITVRLGQTTSLGVVVLGYPLHEIETMVVTAEPLLVDPGETTVGGNLEAEEFRELPLGRGYRQLATLLPHVQESTIEDALNFGGGTGYENKWYVDGADVTDPIFSNQGVELPYNFVRAVQVRVGGYQAEYRGALGGVVDVITRRGSDEFRGEVFGYFLNDQTAGSPRLGVQDPELGAFARWDIGAGLSGPIARDRLWYYLAYNPAFDNEEIDVAGLGLLDNKKTTHRFAGRLDWRANDSNDFTLSVVGNPSRSEGPKPFLDVTPSAFASTAAVMTVGELGVISATLKGFHYLSTAALLESNVSLAWSRNNWTPATEQGASELYFFNQETGVLSGGTWGYGLADGLDFKAGLKATWQLGAHTLKAGAEYRQYRADLETVRNTLNRFFDPDNGTETFQLFELQTSGELGNRTPAAFVQDSWRLGQRLRLNFGLRWNGQYFVDPDGRVATSITDQWQPRLGASYLLDRRGRSKLFGSAGRFYQDLSLYAPWSVLNENFRLQISVYDHDPRDDPSGGTVVYTGDTTLMDHLNGQFYDEITMGYERQLGQHGIITVRGIYREMGESIEDGWDEESQVFVWGNPGRGRLSEYPRPSRDYSAFEITYQLNGAERFNALATYVLSRVRGNMTGISNTDYGGGAPNFGNQWNSLESSINGHGLLSNDRTHVLKFAGSWRAGGGLTVGGTVSWMTGTPLNELGATTSPSPYHTFLVQRGSAGRLSDIWDLSLRLSYDIGGRAGHDRGARIIVDLLHIGSELQVTNVDQKHYMLQDANGNQIAPNPTYGMPTNYQPPFAVRLGAQVSF